MDAETGERNLLTEGAENSWRGSFSPDGRRLVTVVQTRVPGATGKHDLVLFDVDSGERRTLTSDFDAWPGDPRWLDDGRMLRTLHQRGGDSEVLVAEEILEPVK